MSTLRKNTKEFIPDNPKRDKTEKFRAALQVIAKINKGAKEDSNLQNVSLDNAMIEIMRAFDEKKIKLAELKSMRKNFYLSKDYKTEDEIYEKKICGRADAIIALISYRMWQLNNVVKNTQQAELLDFMQEDQTIIMNKAKNDKEYDMDPDYLELGEKEVEGTRDNIIKLGDNIIGKNLSKKSKEVLLESNEKLKTDFDMVFPLKKDASESKRQSKIKLTESSKTEGANLQNNIINNNNNDRGAKSEKNIITNNNNNNSNKNKTIIVKCKKKRNKKMLKDDDKMKADDEDSKESREEVKQDDSKDENEPESAKVKRISNAEKKKIIAEIRERQNLKKKTFSDDNAKLETLLYDINKLYNDLKDFDQRNNEERKPSEDLDDKVQRTWARFLELSEEKIADPGFLIKNFINEAGRGANGEAFTYNAPFTNMILIAYSLLVKVNKMGQLIEKLVSYNNIKRDLERKIAQNGKKGLAINNAAVRKLNKLAFYANDNKFVNEEEWNKLSVGAKTIRRFKFSCYNQNPNHILWKKFSLNEQEEFLKKRLAFWKSEIQQYDYNEENVSNELLFRMDKFFYYMKRDKEGYLIPINKELKEKYSLEKGELELCEELKEYISICSQKRKIYNEMKYNGKWYRTQGKSCVDKARAIYRYNAINSKRYVYGNDHAYDGYYNNNLFDGTYDITNYNSYRNKPRGYYNRRAFTGRNNQARPYDNNTKRDRLLGKKRISEVDVSGQNREGEGSKKDNNMNLEEEGNF